MGATFNVQVQLSTNLTSSSSKCSEDTLALNLDLCILKLHTISLSMHSYNFMHTFMLLLQASGNLCITTNSHA